MIALCSEAYQNIGKKILIMFASYSLILSTSTYRMQTNNKDAYPPSTDILTFDISKLNNINYIKRSKASVHHCMLFSKSNDADKSTRRLTFYKICNFFWNFQNNNSNQTRMSAYASLHYTSASFKSKKSDLKNQNGSNQSQTASRVYTTKTSSII